MLDKMTEDLSEEEKLAFQVGWLVARAFFLGFVFGGAVGVMLMGILILVAG